MKRVTIFLVLIFFLAVPVQAQGEAPHVIRSTKPMSAELRGYLDAWLAVSPPSDAKYYIVTYWHNRADGTVVSLAGVNLDTPESDWSLEDGAVWLGTVVVSATGEVSPLSVTTQARGGGNASFTPRFAGGGAYVAFPFAAGSAAQYGPRGVHGSGDYETSGMLAVDLVGGDGMGATSMPPYTYASDAGTIDYICDDDTSVAVRTHNDDTDDYFLYAHMLANDGLVMDAEFAQGALLGSLKYGSFDDTCGWAEQSSSQYHVHWMFVPSYGKMQVGSCILTVSSQVWQCGDETVRTGGYLVGGGGFSDLGDASGSTGAGSVVTDPTFWDYILTGFLSIADHGILKLLPSHNPFEYTYMLFNVIQLVFRLAWVLVESNINLGPLFTVLLAGIGIKLVFGLIQIGAFLFKAWKSLVPVLGS